MFLIVFLFSAARHSAYFFRHEQTRNKKQLSARQKIVGLYLYAQPCGELTHYNTCMQCVHKQRTSAYALLLIQDSKLKKSASFSQQP